MWTDWQIRYKMFFIISMCFQSGVQIALMDQRILWIQIHLEKVMGRWLNLLNRACRMSQPALYFKWYKIAHGPRANLAWINAQMLNLPCYLGHIIILCVLINTPVPARVTIKWNFKDFNFLRQSEKCGCWSMGPCVSWGWLGLCCWLFYKIDYRCFWAPCYNKENTLQGIPSPWIDQKLIPEITFQDYRNLTTLKCSATKA